MIEKKTNLPNSHFHPSTESEERQRALVSTIHERLELPDDYFRESKAAGRKKRDKETPLPALPRDENMVLRSQLEREKVVVVKDGSFDDAAMERICARLAELSKRVKYV